MTKSFETGEAAAASGIAADRTIGISEIPPYPEPIPDNHKPDAHDPTSTAGRSER